MTRVFAKCHYHPAAVVVRSRLIASRRVSRHSNCPPVLHPDHHAAQKGVRCESDGCRSDQWRAERVSAGRFHVF